MSRISNLEFDSNLFGYPVGKITVKGEEEFNYFPVPHEYKLIYVFSEKELSLDLKDLKEVYHRKTERYPDVQNLYSIRSFDVDKNELKTLAFQSGSFSRFKLDSNFKNDEFEKLYTIWFEKSINFLIAWDVLLFYDKIELQGFVTLGEKNKDTSSIGLIAVKENARGKGIGSILVEQAISYSHKKGYKTIEVITQGHNTGAVNLYKKSDFRLKEQTYIYHLWQ